MSYLKYLLLGVYVFLVGLPIYIFFDSRAGSFTGLDPKSLSLILFPVFGLLAFSLVSMQVIIGPNIRVLRKIVPEIYAFHRFQGLFAFLFAILHPLLLLLGAGFVSTFLTKDVVSPDLRGFILFGQAALLCMLVTVPTAFAAWKLNTFKQSWRWLHYLNYLVFIFAWAHSWFIGSDIRTTSLKYVWAFYLVAGVGSLAIRVLSPSTIGRAPKPAEAAPLP